MRALGMTGITMSRVSALCQGLDERVTAFHQRSLETAYPDFFHDLPGRDSRWLRERLQERLGERQSR